MSLFFTWKTGRYTQEKNYGQDPGKHIEVICNTTDISSSPRNNVGSMCQSARQTTVVDHRVHSQNDGDSLYGDFSTVQMEADAQQLAGAGDRDRIAAGLNAPDAPAEDNMPCGSCGGPRPLTIPAQAQPADH